MMKTNFLTTRICLLLAGPCLLFSCAKNSMNGNSSSANTNSIQPHVYGLLPVSDDEMKNVPIFTPEVLNGGKSTLGLTASSLPSSYLLMTPAIRDQGQIGACTGFCGTESNEIVKYYLANGAVNAQPTINSTSSAIAAVVANKFVSPTTYFGVDGSLAPLFLYYVERVKIEGYSIKQDPGANMVNIGEALSGLTNNTGSGKSISPYGESTEDLYPYPITLNSQGYNVATSSSTQFKTAPSSSAISDAVNFKIATQSGSTTTSGATTTAGYYYIAGTGDTTEVNNCKYAIVNNKPVLMGFTVYDNSAYTVFEGLSTTSYIYNPLTNGKITKGLSALGGHAVPLVGYFNDGTASTSATGGGYFIVQNSWGTPWGYYGHFLLPFSVLRNSSVVGNNNLYVLVK